MHSHYNAMSYAVLAIRHTVGDVARAALYILRAASVCAFLLSPLAIVGVVEYLVDNSLPPVAE